LFVLNKNSGCEVIINMISVIKVSMKFDLDMSDFNASKQTSLVNSMATLLGIDSSQIKIVSIR